MTLENIKLDIDYVRSQFPAFKDPLSKDWSFFENAGGSYVPKNVIDKLTEFMTSTKVQPYAEYPMSKIAGENMDKATKLFANMINSKEHIIEYFNSGIKEKKNFKIGIEHEKFLFNNQNNKRADYSKIKEMFFSYC